MQPCDFVQQLSELEFDDVFNPYMDRCQEFDRWDAPRRRRELLLATIEAAAAVELDSLWVGRDLGYRGGRRTGIALTDDIHLEMHARRWAISFTRATKGKPMGERTAAIIWNVLSGIRMRIFLWNIFPLHPHQPGEPFTNRPHRRVERIVGEDVLANLIDLLRPRRVIAIGSDAGKSISRIVGKSTACTSELRQVRHPSYGGHKVFVAQINGIYGS